MKLPRAGGGRLRPPPGASRRKRPSRRTLIVGLSLAWLVTLALLANLLPVSPVHGWLDTLTASIGPGQAAAPESREARLARVRADMAAAKTAVAVTAGTPAGPEAQPGTAPAATGPELHHPAAAAAAPAILDEDAPPEEAAASADPGAGPLDRGPRVAYSGGGRDPFRSLLLTEPDYSLASLEDARLVGVAWNHEQMVAMIEDRRGRTWSLREGDRVQSGRVVRITQTAAIIDTWIFGNSERKVLELAPKEEESQP